MHKPLSELTIEVRKIGRDHPTYFIVDIASSHDGDIERAKALIYLAKEAGADAAKFQHFQAETIVSDYGFRNMGGQFSHQASWKKSVFETYKDASVPLEWTPILKETCDKAGITFFTSPYAFDLVDHVDPFLNVYKIGSGDITWPQIIEYIAKKKKPYIIATGAATTDDVVRAVNAGLRHNPAVSVMQCNTNYTGSLENFKYINLNVLNTYRQMWPEMVLGLSDHTPGHATVLGAVAMGARMVEKHFTDDTTRDGPDHGFSMDPKTWREMVDRTRELEYALGTAVKKIEDNEDQTVELQRRGIRLKRAARAGEKVTDDMLISLRPCPKDGLPPWQQPNIIGKTLTKDLPEGECVRWTDLA